MCIVNIIGTWRPEALPQLDHEDCQCHRSKNIKRNKKGFFVFVKLYPRVDEKWVSMRCH